MNKRLISFIALCVTLISIYHLSFTLVDIHINNKATKHSTDELGNVDFVKKQLYIESIKNKTVYNIAGLKYTYDQVQNNSIKLGLDLKGGMHAVVEISYAELIKELANPSKELDLILDKTTQLYNKGKDSFITIFYKVYKESGIEQKLAGIFVNKKTNQFINLNSTDQEVISFLDQQLKQSIERAFNIIRTRLDRFGTSQINIQYLGTSGRIQIEFPGATDPEQIKKILKSVAKLSFFEVYDSRDLLYNKFKQIDTLLIKEKQLFDEQSNSSKGVGSISQNSPLYALLKPQYGIAYAADNIEIINSILSKPAVKAILPNDIQFAWGSKPIAKEDGVEIFTLTPLKGKKPLLGGDVISQARQVFDEKGSPAVSMQMNSYGTKIWKHLTSNNIGKQIAILLDDKVISAPVVNVEIPNGLSQISGNFSIEEAKDLANILKSGSMPAPIHIVEEAIIGPTLGKTAQSKGIYSMAIGLISIMLFMVIYYAQAGMIANFTLLFNMLFIFGAMAQLTASLTLSGIAGIVLTIGMAIDANVLIFERIKEELKNDINLKNAIKIGYKKTYSAILDSNITTFLTGVILYIFGQGSIRGFATTLMIGIVSSLFSSVLISRLIMDYLANRSTNLTFKFRWSDNFLKNMNFDFIKYRFIYYFLVSLMFMVVGISCLIYKGINLGIDFSGGNSYVVKFHKPVNLEDLKQIMNTNFPGYSNEIKTYGASNIVRVTTSYIQDEADKQNESNLSNRVIKILSDKTQLKYVNSVSNNRELDEGTFTLLNSSKIEGSMANDVKKSATKSIMLSLLMIFIYIFFRFKSWQFGIASTIALVHDTIMIFACLGISSYLGNFYEVDQVFIAAILTVIGYSINDTVVIFDRIRENIGIAKKQLSNNMYATINKSINETLSRTIITSFTTLLAVAILFIFGGEALKGFSFSLLTGIIFGTYSSIFMAAPLAYDFYRKKKA
jgi:SecD/SecF fusion protein